MKIENYRDSLQGSKEIARFDVSLDKIGITLHEFRIVKKKDGSGWFIAAPSFCHDLTGTKRWLPYFSFTEARKKEFYDKLHEMVKEIMEQ